jgi:flagellar biosynthesis component FlhA
MWEQLEQTFGLGGSPAGTDDQYPVVTPIVGEVGDALVPIVDSRRDQGHFLYELIPDLRARIHTDTGVTVPGVRMRGNAGLAPDAYVIQIDEVPVLTGTIDPLGYFTVTSPLPDSGPFPSLRADVHPLTGQAGAWAPPGDTGHPADESRVPAPLFLAYRIEAAVRSALSTFFGYEEAASLLAEWESDGAVDLVAALAPDEAGRFRLLRLLRALIEDRVPLTDWREVLEAVRDVGGTDTALTVLVPAVRHRCRERLPGNEPDTVRVRVPEDLEALVVVTTSRPFDPAAGTAVRQYRDWLAEVRAHTQGRIAVVTGSQQARHAVEHLTRSTEFLVPVLSADELAAPAEAERVTSVPGGVR